MCLNIIEISGYVDGVLDEPAVVKVENHITTCLKCKNMVANFRFVSRTVNSLPVKTVSPVFADTVIEKISALEPVHPAFETISLYCDQILPASEIKVIQLHLQDCSRCQNILNNIRTIAGTAKTLSVYQPSESFAENVLARLEAEESVLHPAFDSISSYYDNTLGVFESKSIEKHLAACSDCRKVYNNIRGSSGALATVDIYEPSPGFLDNLMKKIDELPEMHFEEIPLVAEIPEKVSSETVCISSEDLSAYLDDETTSVKVDYISEHLESCSKCKSKLQSFRLSRKITGNLLEPQVPFNFSRKVLEQINKEEESPKVVPFIRRSAHKVSMVAGIVVAGILVTMSNPFTNMQTAQQANIPVNIMAEDFLFSNNSSAYRQDSLEVLVEDNSNDDLLIQEIGF